MTNPKHTDTSRSGDLVKRDTVCAGDKPYTNGIRDLAEMPHVSEQLGNVFRDCARIIDERNDRIEALEAEVERLRELLDAWLGLAREHLDTELAGRTFEALERTRK